MTSKHTAERWELLPETFSPKIWVVRVGRTSDELAIASIINRDHARLIAAAPDLLAVVREACAIFDMNREGDEFNGDLASDLWKNEIHEKLTAAIAKATAS